MSAGIARSIRGALPSDRRALPRRFFLAPAEQGCGPGARQDVGPETIPEPPGHPYRFETKQPGPTLADRPRPLESSMDAPLGALSAGIGPEKASKKGRPASDLVSHANFAQAVGEVYTTLASADPEPITLAGKAVEERDSAGDLAPAVAAL